MTNLCVILAFQIKANIKEAVFAEFSSKLVQAPSCERPKTALRILYDVKSVSQPDTMPIFENNYLFQITETRFAEQFYASHRMGPALICFKISA